MNLTLIYLSTSSLNLNPFISIHKSTHFQQFSFHSLKFKYFFSNFIFSNNLHNSIKISKSTFSNYLNPVLLNQNLNYNNEIFSNNEILIDNSTEEVSIIDCYFVNYSSLSSIILIGDKKSICSDFTLSGTIFQDCFSSEYGLIKAYLSKITLKQNCFINVSSQEMATVAYLVISENNNANAIQDTSFFYCYNDAVANNAILSFITGKLLLQRLNMSYCSAQSPAFIQTRRSSILLQTSTFSHSQTASCMNFIAVDSPISITNGMFYNVSLAFEIVVFSAINGIQPKLTLSNYILKLNPGSNRPFSGSKDCTVTLNECYSEYPFSLYFMKDIVILIYNSHVTSSVSLYSWKFPAMESCVIQFTNQQKTIPTKQINYIPYIVLTSCGTILIMMLLLTIFVIIKSKPQTNNESSSLTLGFSVDNF